MSFVKKAVKKVFKFAKKVVKKTGSFLKRAWNNKWVRMAIIIAASVFTAGLASGGFAAFSGVNSIGGFFGAVGQTMATGWTAITGAVANAGKGFASLFTGGTTAAEGTALAASGEFVAPLASSVGTATAEGAALAGATGATPLLGVSLGTTAATTGTTGLMAAGTTSAASLGALEAAGLASAGQFVAPLMSNVTSSAGAKGFIGKFGNLLLDKGWGGTLLRSSIAQGFMGYYQNKDREREEWYWRQRTVWGGPAFGGDAGGIQLADPVAVMAQNQQPTSAAQMAQQSAQQPVPGAQAQQQQGLLATGGMTDPRAAQQQMAAEQQLAAASGVPAQQTQPPPATQPQQGRTPGLLQLEQMGVA